jgi:Ser/Thr protein kinase RdoA (MazF antagonist)
MAENFPVIHSILSTAALTRDVLPDFNIGEIAACQFFTGGFNDTYRVKTVQGSTYYLRLYRKDWRTLPDILYELDVLNHLRSKGFRTARPMPCRNGFFYHEISAPEGTRYAALFSEAPGKEISYDRETAEMSYHYGQAVAQLHNAMDDFASPHQRFHIDLELLIDSPLRNIAPFLAHRPDDWSYLQRFAANLRQRIVDLPIEALEQGFCHGDLQGYHAYVDDDSTLTFFDFDCGGRGYRAYDLAVFRWCSRLEKQEEHRWEPYLRGYRELRPLNELDIQAVPLFVGARYLWHMGVHTQNAPDWGCEWLNDKYFDEKLGFLRTVEKDYF